MVVADLAPEPLAELAARVPDFPKKNLWQADFFALNPTENFDLLIEQTFFCALDPSLRPAYARQCAALLRPGGKLVGLLFDTEFAGASEPPFGGSRPEYHAYFAPYFRFIHFDTAYNSLAPRAGRELEALAVRADRGADVLQALAPDAPNGGKSPPCQTVRARARQRRAVPRRATPSGDGPRRSRPGLAPKGLSSAPCRPWCARDPGQPKIPVR